MNPITDIATQITQNAPLIGDDLSLLALFLRADIVVQSILVGLFLTSIWVWGVIIEKVTTMRRLTRQATRFEQLFWSKGELNKIHVDAQKLEPSPIVRVFFDVMKEWKLPPNAKPPHNKELVNLLSNTLSVSIARESEKLERRMIFLATTGATAPFVGLLGTVWGIMNSFRAIALSQDTNLAVVAPGIAEALFATGLGLFTAIPAVVAYNMLNKTIDTYVGRLDNFASSFINIVLRWTKKDT